MKTIFYDHLIRVEEIFAVIDDFDITIEEKTEFYNLIDNTFHSHILEIILSDLSVEFHEEFLIMFHQSPHRQELLEFLKQKGSGDIENKIKAGAEKIKKGIFKDIKRSKKK